MAFESFEEIKRYVGFGDADAQRLAALRDSIEPFFRRTVDRFYAEIERRPEALAVLSGHNQIARLKTSLSEWLWTLFCGDYDQEYYDRRARIGRMHVKVGLRQEYMFGGMDIVRQELEAAIRQVAPANLDACLDSLHKLLALELSVMLETYRDSYEQLVREAERASVKERLTRAEHLAEIGQLAASLAHEIKNPLAGISGAVQVIRDAAPAGDPHRPILAEILRQIDRLDRTVKDLLIYARPVPPRLQECRLDRVIERVATFFGREPELQRLRLVHVRGDPTPAIEADEHQVEQVLMNLVLNAAHASHDGGSVRIRTTVREDGVQLRVEDDGHGMDEELQRRAFQPFFTTRARGTGLGLPICKRIIEEHGGELSIESTPGRGTNVTVSLPRRAPKG
ncbi:MAG: protoglobin domain-containing protein [Phycisphaerae bacterium]